MKKIILLSFLLGVTVAQAQVGFGTASPEAMLHVVKPTNVTNAVKIEGLSSATTESVSSLVIDESGIVKKKDVSTSLMPKFFYMPSVVLPTTQDQVTALNNSNITHENGVFTVDLYALFKAQFDAPIKSSNAVAATTNPNVSSLSDFVLSRSAYEYHVIYADANVFPHTNISFLTGADNEGKLTYKVNSNAIVDNGSFMNIVLKVK